MNLPKNLENVQKKIANSLEKSVENARKINLIAVTKYFDADMNEKLYAIGQKDFGENRVEKFVKKCEKLSDKQGIVWHFIGNLQRRRVKDVIDLIDFFHALDSFKLAVEIEKRATKKIKCFVEVNVSGEGSKRGFKSAEVRNFINNLVDFTKIEVVGLMTLAPIDADKKDLIKYFGALKKLQKEIAALNLSYAPCAATSMGMSSDFEVAVECGADYVRVGQALYV